MLKLTDAVPRPRGDFSLRVYRCGELVETFEEKNLVVDVSKTTLSRLLGGDTTDRSITTIAFGESGTAAAAGNTSITTPLTKAVDAVSYPSSTQVQFDFSLSTAEGNGKGIWEFGLLTEGGALFARKVRASVLNKDSDLALEGSWIITF